MSLSTVVLILLSLAIAGYVALAIAITVFQRRLIYMPDPRRTTPQDAGFDGVEVAHVATADGERLVVWYAPAPPGQPTVVYFHGNAGWIELRNERLAALRNLRFGVVMMSYRGYGGSTGAPSESANVADAKRVYDWVRGRGVEAGDIVLFGESLGTGVATQLAGAKLCAGLVLDSPYTSMADLAQGSYPWLPVRRLLFDHYETVRHIKRVTVPVLVLHGEADELVPAAMGRAVHAAAVAPKRLVTYPGAAHLDHLPLGSMQAVTRFVHKLPRTQAAAKEKPGTSPGLESLNPYG
jgi:uncharacterized protein